MSTQAMSPGRRRALALSGSKIRPDVQYAAPDGHPMGPGVPVQLATKVEKPLLETGSTKAPAAERRLPFAARK